MAYVNGATGPWAYMHSLQQQSVGPSLWQKARTLNIVCDEIH